MSYGIGFLIVGAGKSAAIAQRDTAVTLMQQSSLGETCDRIKTCVLN
ncbi:hypothetical protein ACQ4M4_02215 [Leptolyngbya sp. AN02str]